jgi:hypothetical protein
MCFETLYCYSVCLEVWSVLWSPGFMASGWSCVAVFWIVFLSGVSGLTMRVVCHFCTSFSRSQVRECLPFLKLNTSDGASRSKYKVNLSLSSTLDSVTSPSEFSIRDRRDCGGTERSRLISDSMWSVKKYFRIMNRSLFRVLYAAHF